MRERHVMSVPGVKRIGITPACAGKTAPRHPCPGKNQDHPRMCGKDSMNSLYLASSSGSPPHVRERLLLRTNSLTADRITPACAGKTTHDIAVPQLFRDHPRMCGKDRPRSYPGSFFSRITPACAGKTVMDPFIFALLRLPTFKIYLISLLNI